MFDLSCLSHFLDLFLPLCTASPISHIPRWEEGKRLLVHGSPIPAPPCDSPCHARGKTPFKNTRSGSFPTWTLPFSPQPQLLLGAAGSNSSCVIADCTWPSQPGTAAGRAIPWRNSSSGLPAPQGMVGNISLPSLPAPASPRLHKF